ncbi:MAG: PAS domain S-box protein [Blastocatellia bacterium]
MSEVDFSKRATTVLLRYGLAVSSAGLALLLTRLLGHAADATPTPLFFAAVMITAWYGGVGPGLVAIAVSTIAIDFFLIAPDAALTVSLADLSRVATFALSAILINSLGAARRRAEEALRQERDRLEIEVKRRTSELAEANDSLQTHITERRLAEQEREQLVEELKTERALMEAVLRQMPAGVVIAEAPSGKVILGNKQVEEMLRHDFSPVDGVEQYEAYACYSADGRAYDPKEMPLARSILTGEVINGEEIHFVRGDGTVGKVLLSSCPILDGGGEIVAGVAVFHDITERKQAEQALRESEERYRELFENANDVVYTLDMSGNFTSLNKACERLTGYAREELLGQPLARFVSPAHLEMMRGMMRRKMEGDARTNYELEVKAKGGRVLVVEVSSRLIYERGVPTGIQGIARDITERKSAEEAMRQSEERFSKAFNSSPHPMSITSLDEGRYLDVNDALLRDVGYKREEIIGRTVAELDVYVDPSDRARIFRALDERGSIRDMEVRFRAKGGDTLFFSLSADTITLNGQKCLLTASHNVTESKRAEAALRASERRLSLIYESVDDCLFLLSVEGGDCYRFVSVNEAFLAVTGFTREQVIDRRVEEVLPESSHALVISKYREAIRLNKTVRWEEVAALPAGKRVGEVLVTPMADEVDGSLHLIGAVHDITERKRAEEAILLSEKQYRTLADAVPQLVWMNNAEGMKKYFNERWQEYTGTRPEEHMDMSWLSVIHPDDIQTVIEVRTKGVEAGEGYEFECRMRRADGEYRWHICRVLPLKGDGGQVLQWFGTATDIHDIKLTEESTRFLAEAGSLLASSLDEEVTVKSMTHLAVPYLADWCLVDLLREDGSVERVPGRHGDPSKEGWLAKLIQNYPYNYSGDAESCASRVLRTGRPEIANEVADGWPAADDPEHSRILRELGLGSYMVVPLVTRGRTLGAMSFMSARANRYGASALALAQDLAHRAVLAIDNARLYREAQEANRVKDEFLATVSHELRTPLNAILGWAEILRAGKIDEAAKARALDTIVRNGKSQAQLIEDILDVSRIITGKLRLDVRPVGLASVINAAVDAMRPAAIAKDIDLRMSLDDSAGVVSGDPGRLQQVVWNLISNAIKFTPAKGTVEVRLERSDSHAQVVISDTGVGIKPEFLPHVFDLFRQADSSYTRRHGGLGLGLAIVRHLVETHGGTIRAESAGEGEGATFTLRLPLLKDEARGPRGGESKRASRRAARGSPFGPGAMLAGLWLLVVDDERDARELISTVLEQYGATVMAVGSAAEALDVLAGCESVRLPDMILSDIGMPGEDGLSFIEQVRAGAAEKGAKIPAIALTAYARAEDRARVLRAGYQLHISKPFEPLHLVTAIASFMRQVGKGFGN